MGWWMVDRSCWTLNAEHPGQSSSSSRRSEFSSAVHLISPAHALLSRFCSALPTSQLSSRSWCGTPPAAAPVSGMSSAAGTAMASVLSPLQPQTRSRQQRRRRPSASTTASEPFKPTFSITPQRAQQPFTFTVNLPNVQPRLRGRQPHPHSHALRPSCLQPAPPSASPSCSPLNSTADVGLLVASKPEEAEPVESLCAPPQHSDGPSLPSLSPTSACSSRQPVYRKHPPHSDGSPRHLVPAPTPHFVWPAVVAPAPPARPSSPPEEIVLCLSDDDSETAAEEQTAQSTQEEKDDEFDAAEELNDSAQQDTAAEEDEAAAAQQLESGREAERALLRSRCQQFILQLVSHPESEAEPPWRSCSDAGDPIAAEYEPLYQQLLSSVQSRGGERSKEPTRDSREAGSAPRGSVTSSGRPRHSFSLLLPAFHTLHAVARQVMMSRRREREAEDSGEPQQQQQRDAVEPVSELPLADVAQPDGAAPADSQQLQPLSPLSPAPSSRRPRRVFYSKYRKVQELRALWESRAAAAPSALSITSSLPLPPLPPLPTSPLSATTPLPINAISVSAEHRRRVSLTATGKQQPSSPSHALTASSQSPRSAASLPRITAHPFVSPQLARPLQLGIEAESALYVEKLEAVEQSRQRCRERRERDERRRRWAERMQPKDVKKWGRRGRKRKVRMRVEDGFLLWGAAEHWQPGQGDEERRRRWRQQEKEGKVIDLRSVRGIVPGLNPRLRARVPFSLSVLCFAVLGSARVLECECADVMDRDDWMDGLTQEVEEAKTLSCSWSGRLLCSVQHDSSITLTIAEGDEGISFI